MGGAFGVGLLYGWFIQGWGTKSATTDVTADIRATEARYFQRIKQLDQIKALDPIAFERFVGSLFEQMGYNTQTTSVSGDEGVDLKLPETATNVPSTSTPLPPTDTPTSTNTSVPIPTATPEPAADYQASAWVSVPNPGRRSNQTVFGQLTKDGVGIAGAQVYCIVHYKSVDSRWPESGLETTGSDGIASIVFNIGGASSGYTVDVDVYISYTGRTYHVVTSFTPQY